MKNVADIYPLTPTQAGLLFHTLQVPDAGIYFDQYLCTLRGAIDMAAFRQSWQTAVNRHAVLRTAFIWDRIDEPLQVVRKHAELPFAYEDWRGTDPSAQEDRLDAFLRLDRKRGFDLSKAPLSRLALFQIDDDRHHLVWSHHHLLLDGWSTGLVLKEVFAGYDDLRQGRTPAHHSPPEFKHYVAWLKQRDLDPAESFWRTELAGFTAPTDLRVARETAAHPSAGRYAQHRTSLSAALTTSLQAVARQQRLTLNTLIQGAWAILLSRYSGEDDVVFGTTVSGRSADLPGIEAMIGILINTLPTRIQLDPKQPLHRWLEDIQAGQLQVRRHEHTPLAKIQAWSDAPKGQALFETLIVFENFPTDSSAFAGDEAGLRVEAVRYLEQSNYPLSLLVLPGRRLGWLLIYDNDRYTAGVIDRLSGHLETLLGGLADNLRRPLGEIPMLTSAERQLLLEVGSAKPAEDRHAPLIQHDFEQHAARHPEKLAVVDPEGRLSYGELNRRANQLANYLQRFAVAPNTVVGLMLERSSDMVVAILAVLKAGGAYLPLDPAYPRERLAHMLADTQAPLVVTRRKFAALLPDSRASRILMDADAEAIAREEGRGPEISTTSEHFAYVIYTSGSTGTPKGVPVSHRNLVHSTTARFGFYDRPVGRFLLLPSFTFDSSVAGIFWTLCQGGTLVLPPQRIEQDLRQLEALIATERVSALLTLPSLYTLLLAHADVGRLDTLRTVIMAGEACRPGLATAHYSALPQADLFNEYGPTEGTVWCTAYQIPPDFTGARVPIGKPIPNMQCYVVDAHGQLAPVGLPGELCIAGAGVTSGYLNRPELTAEKFRTHRFAEQAPVRLYHTGDLARYLPDGNLEYLGRMDHQVKIRGYRVELGEIEATLDQHPSVGQVAVVAHETAGASDTASTRLVAYVAPTNGQSVSIGELRRFLLDRLPDYMVPASLVLLDELPLSPNGKIDRKRLPPPDRDHESLSDAAFVAPRTTVEEKLAAIWATVLGVERVGIQDNFFELGGDSILSIQIIAKAAQQKIKLKPNALFQYPTVAALALVAATGDGDLETQQSAVSGPVPLTPIQHWFFEQPLTAPHHWNQSYLLALSADVDLTLVERSLQHLFLHHDALRLRFRRNGSGWTQENDGPQLPMRISHIDFSDMPAHEQGDAFARTLDHLQQSLDLASGGLASAAIFSFGPGRSPRLLLLLHHLVVDGVSWQVLLEDFDTTYRQMSGSQPVTLPPKTSSFQLWAQRLDAFAQSAAVEQDLAFWLQMVPEDLARLTPDYPDGRARNTTASAVTHTVALSQEETEALWRQVPAAYQTQINDALLTALLLAFSEKMGTAGLFFDLEGHGREALFDDIDLSRTVGWFTAVFPLWLRLPEDADIGRALMAVKEQLREVPRKGMSYGVLRYMNRNEAVHSELARLPTAEITFNYFGQFDHSLSGYSFFQKAMEAGGTEHAPQDQRRYLLEINSMSVGGRLITNWTYGRKCFRPATIETLAQGFVQHLQAIIAHCSQPETGGYTPSDFPEADLDQQALDDLLDEFGEEIE